MNNLLNIYEKNSIKLSKKLIKELGLYDALILAFLADKWGECGYNSFYYIIAYLSKETGLSDRICRKSIQNLINKNILIKTKFQGLPPKQYYTINNKIKGEII